MENEMAQIILDELREFRKDTNSRLISLEGSRSEGRGVVKTILSASAISALVSWVTGTLHH